MAPPDPKRSEIKELAEIKEALAAFFSNHCQYIQDDKSYSAEVKRAMELAASLFLPFLELYFRRQADVHRGVYADEMRALYGLKAALGMPLKAHEQPDVTSG